jgi:hypothetical protein
MNIKGKIAATVATGAFALSTFATSAFAYTNVEISGNGAFSDNRVSVTQNERTRINQRNDANIVNNVSIRSNTGGNDANFNTGGDVFIRTGDIDSTVRINNRENLNRLYFHRDRDCLRLSDLLRDLRNNSSNFHVNVHTF